MLGHLLDRIAAVEQDALVTIDIGDLEFAAPGRGVAGIVVNMPVFPYSSLMSIRGPIVPS